MSEESRLHSIPHPRVFERRLLILFLLASVALVFLFLNLAGSQKTFKLIQSAQPFFILCTLGAHLLRHVATTGSTNVLSEVFGQRLSFWPLLQATLAAQAANRTFSIGGAAGVVVRYSYLHGRGLSTGSFLFLVGITIVLLANPNSNLSGLVWFGFVAGAIALALATLYLYNRRALVERIAHGVSRRISAWVARFTGKSLYKYENVHRAVDDFYSSMAHARRDPARFGLAFLFSLLRMSSDAVALYFAFLAIGFNLAPALVLVVLAIATTVSNLSGVPGQIGVMETSLAVLSTSLGIPMHFAVGAILLYRAISYWLPLPLGYIAFWNLQRRGLLLAHSE